MASLHELGLKYGADKATFHQYCDFYQQWLPDPAKFKGRLLEIGVMDGASLRMWAEYYPDAEIVGVDIYDKSHLVLPANVTVYTMDVTDAEQMDTLGTFDIIVDDGSHMTQDQIDSFEWLFKNQLSRSGRYIIEDLHTSLSDFPGRYINSDELPLDMLERVGVDFEYFRRDPGVVDSCTSVVFKTKRRKKSV